MMSIGTHIEWQGVAVNAKVVLLLCVAALFVEMFIVYNLNS